jgi:hypothetical protein
MALALACAAAGPSRADDAADAISLHASYSALRQQLERNAFQRPLHLDSSEAGREVTGDIHAIIDSPFEAAGKVLADPGAWCDIMMLPINTKGCRASRDSHGMLLSLWIGTKARQSLADASRVDFAYQVRALTAPYLRVALTAGEGPFGTHDYRITLEAVPLENGRTFIHLAYSYGYGVFGQLAMNAYLATLGTSKVGFTVVGAPPGGEPSLIGGVRGAVERNSMRYFLAIEAFLGALSAAPADRFEKRIRDWYAASERYPRQLHEMEPGEYLDMKRQERLHQQASLPEAQPMQSFAAIATTGMSAARAPDTSLSSPFARTRAPRRG